MLAMGGWDARESGVVKRGTDAETGGGDWIAVATVRTNFGEVNVLLLSRSRLSRSRSFSRSRATASTYPATSAAI